MCCSLFGIILATFGAPGLSGTLPGPNLGARPKKGRKSWFVDRPPAPIGGHNWRHFRNRNEKEETIGRFLQRPERQKRRSVATLVLRGVFGCPGDPVNKVNVAKPP